MLHTGPLFRMKEQDRIHGSINQVRVGRASHAVGQGYSNLQVRLLARNTKKEVITDGWTNLLDETLPH